ncbi:MAG: DUF418 domain-containing protein [Candidatus Hydrogenedentales bacterium]
MESEPQSNTAGKRSRIVGLDVARAIAIFGMVFVNYKNAMNARGGGPDWLLWLLDRFDGRASVTFVTLAGMGAVLLSQQARESGDPVLRRAARMRVFRRALFIFVLGLGLFRVWPGDILHFYGLYMATGALLLYVPIAAYPLLALTAVAVAAPLRVYFDHGAGYGPDHMWYLDFWSLEGFPRNLFYNGFHPYFPWVGFFLMGMWLARRVLARPERRTRYLVTSVIAMLGAEFAMRGWRDLLWRSATFAPEWRQTLVHWYERSPGILHAVATQATAFSVILLCLILCERYPRARTTRALANTGQLALTHYLGHIFLVLGPLLVMNELEDHHARLYSVAFACGYLAAAVLFSVWWRSRFPQGPLEWVMRRIAG